MGSLARQPRAGMTIAEGCMCMGRGSSPCEDGRVATRPYEPKSSLRRGGSRAARLPIEARPFTPHLPAVWNEDAHLTPSQHGFNAFWPIRSFPNDRSGFCQICSWLNCSALCPTSLRAKLIAWKQTAHYRVPLCLPHCSGMLSRAAADINPTTKTPRHKELTHFRSPRAEMGILRILVSVSSLVSSCLVFCSENR